MMTDSEILRVVEAHIEGNKIQCKYKREPSALWWHVTSPNWDFSEYDFRVSPEPGKPREWWINPCRDDAEIMTYKNVMHVPPTNPNRGQYIRVREVME